MPSKQNTKPLKNNHVSGAIQILSIAPLAGIILGILSGAPPRGFGPQTRTIAFDADEGTFINVDVAPNGKTLVFDLLGDIYSLPIGGGTARNRLH